ncbi:hypothetical protein HELRODRAFT_182699 [Helobdella robusta]|uniref:Uncharacterized protein n=1 Tax=Helobdella robusta TaxID=6412 RepID=T1FIL5_HELRO|nr:hypothetical protein HELRODRAFT_182699 [Helobdella robusta]ESN90202.1 hypothetical protein HELRODRAFT_182699 [Helobdella robusta]
MFLGTVENCQRKDNSVTTFAVYMMYSRGPEYFDIKEVIESVNVFKQEASKLAIDLPEFLDSAGTDFFRYILYIGIDETSQEMLKGIGKTMNKALHKLIQKIFHQEIPADWGKVEIVPIYKQKGDKKVCKNYKGITLLSIPGKIYTKML